MSERLGEAVLDLYADTSRLEKGFDRAEATAKGSADQMEKAVGGAADGMGQDVDQAAQGMKQSLGGTASAAQGDAGRIESAFGSAASDIESEMAGAGADAEQSIGDIGDAARNVATVIGGALAVDAAVNSLDDATKASGRLETRLGLTEKQAESFDEVAKNVYRKNLGESMTEATNAVSTVHQALGSTGDELQEHTEIIFGITDAFGDYGAEVPGVAKAVSAMKAAFPGQSEVDILDQITFGYQKMGPKADDMLDTITEYAPHFKSIGLTADDMFNFVRIGAENGANSTDLLGDAVKEMGIRVKTAGDTGQKALYKMFPKNEAKRLIDDFAKGGKAGRDAFYTIMEQLSSTKDEQERYNLATQLFGTQGEDLVGVIDKMTPAFLESKDAQDKSKGATKDLGRQYGGIKDTMEGVKRKIETSFVGAVGDAAGAVVGFGGQAGMAVMGASALTGTNVASMIGNWVKLAAQSLLQAGRVAMAWLIAMGPIPLIALAVAGLAILIVKNWDEIKEFLSKTWGKIKDTAAKVWTAIKDFLAKNWKIIALLPLGPLGLMVGLILKHWDKIKDATSRIWTAIKTTIGNLATGIKNTVVSAFTGLKDRTVAILTGFVTFVKNIPGRVMNGVRSLVGSLAQLASNAFGGFKDRVVNIINNVVTFLRKLPGRITGAIGDLSSLLYDEGRALITGLLNGIKDGLKAVWEEVGSIAGKIKDLKGPLPEDLKLLQPEGGAIIDGLWAGMESQLSRVEANVTGIAPDLAGSLATGIPAPSIPSVEGTASMRGNFGAATQSLNPSFDVKVYVGDRELKEIINVEVDSHGHELGQIYVAGAGGI